MKTKFLISILALLIIEGAFCQNTIVLTFEAEYYGSGVSTESIFIENLTQGGDITITGNTLELIYTGISLNPALSEENFRLSQNRPNPFKDQTVVSIFLPEADRLQLSVMNLLGQKVAFFENSMDAGNHSFLFNPGDDKYYIFSVTVNGWTKAIKMVSLNNHGGKSASLTYQGSDEIPAEYKTIQEISEFLFSLGDTLRFTGYAETLFGIVGTDVIIHAPEVNTLYTFNIIEGIPCSGTPTVTYEGQTYKTVQIGDQCWFKENLNVGTMIPGNQVMADNGILEKYCYNDEPDSCAKYGGLYLWDEMMQYTTTQGVQGICPEGWHLPTDFFYPEADWCVMMQFIDPTVECMAFNTWTGTDIGVRMKSIKGWNFDGNGTNTHGFTAIPAGIRNLTFFNHIGNKAFFWSSSQGAADGAWGLTIEYNNERIIRFNYYKTSSFSVRCIKDE